MWYIFIFEILNIFLRVNIGNLIKKILKEKTSGYIINTTK